MDINSRPDIICDDGLKHFICSCLDYVRYEGLIDSSTHDTALRSFQQLIRDNNAYETFIRDLKHNCGIVLERSKLWP